MTREGMGTSEGFGVEKISAQPAAGNPAESGMPSHGQPRRSYLVLLLLVDLEDEGKERVKPAVQAELCRVTLAEGEIKPFMSEAAAWAQTGLKSRAAMEGDQHGA